jgi:Ca2+-binding EF-hand superfamily protein
MIKILLGGAAAVAAVAGGAAVAQTAKPAAHGQRGFAMKNETRADVQANVQKMFAKLDTNHDGFITAAEIDAVQAQRAERMKARADRFDPSKAFARLDSNHDGKITPDEVEAARDRRIEAKGGQPAATHTNSFRGLFARADANKDGAVTAAEFNTVGEQLKARMEKAGMPHGMGARMLTAADTNKDGKVSPAEEQQFALARFDRADLNHDGTLTPQERQKVRQVRKAERQKG